ncbi:cytochrome P450 [Steroidobacter cummioxidans]|uniref:cytochrome P450 n=1 Tax=Steroidobacter cummioxidans TaxID=1803913 RepID=UPI000E315F7B|nr:cytochrome P450 [Steroidobacter cummioxidans]
MSCPITMRALENADPFPAYETLRQQGTVVWDDSLKGWLVLDAELCRHVELNEPALFRNMYADADPLIVELKGGLANITVSQGEQHSRMRRFHQTLLSPRALASYREQIIVPIIQAMLDRVLAKGGRADLAADFGDEIPPRVICALLGMPWQDDELIRKTLQLNEEIMKWIGRGYYDEEGVRDARAASAAINDILLPFIRERRERPQDDFISRVWKEAPHEYGELSEADALAICRELYLGGADTTVHGIANSLYLLLWNPEIRSAVANDREQLANVIEEAQRLYGSPQWRYRRANQDCNLGGVDVAKDQVLILLHGAANRDPKRFGQCPSHPDLARPRMRDHLTFGYGPRSCVGMGLARMEMRDALNGVLDRLPNVRPDLDAEPPRFANLFMRSYRPLHVLFDA